MRKPAIEAALLIITAIVILISIEYSTKVFILARSSIERRIKAEFGSAVATRSNGMNHTVLLLGNSLLAHGVQMDLLNASLPTGWKAKRFVVEDTSFYDWYYGIRRLISAGSRPDAIILMLSIRQLTTSRIRGEYFAHHLMKPSDIFQVARDVDLHPTAVFGLFSGNLSSFYGTRVEIRKQVLGFLLPDFVNLTRLIIPSQSGLQDKAPRKLIERRFYQLSELEKASSIPLAYLIAPDSLLNDETIGIAQRSALKADINVLVGLKPDELRPDDFSDGFHLSEQGSNRFTTSLAVSMQRYLTDIKGITNAQRAMAESN